MKRRKTEMKWIKEDVTPFLLRNDNNPHKSWDEYIKNNLMGEKLTPYYIKGLKDFINVSKEIEIENLLENKKRFEKEEYINLKNQIIKAIKNIKSKDAHKIWNEYKTICSQREKLILSDLCSMIMCNKYYLNDEHINLCLKYKLVAN